MSEALVTLTIDGKEVTVPEGTLVVDAAKQVGIEIPVFCYHPKIEPAGMCRMCLVEVGEPKRDRATGEIVRDENGEPVIEFRPKLETSCTLPVSEGMVVRVMSEKAVEARREIVEFLLTSHPLDCPICDKGGECSLQNLAMEHGPDKSRFEYEDKKHLPKHVPLALPGKSGGPARAWDGSPRPRPARRHLFRPGFRFLLLRQYHRHLPRGGLNHRRFPLRGSALGVERIGLLMHALPGGLQSDVEHPPGGRLGWQGGHQAGDASPKRGGE